MNPGQELGSYRIVRPIGQGGMGVVYLAVQQQLGRNVALKFLAPAAQNNADQLRRFDREMRLAASLTHPALVKCLDLETIDDMGVIVMEYVEGWDLGTVLKRRGMIPWPLSLAIGCRVADGLSYLHQQGVLHRDVKPGNILLGSGGEVKLADFGLAMANNSTRLTRTGDWVGTVQFSAPEILRGSECTTSSDLWALGCCLYLMLTGEWHVKPEGERTALKWIAAVANTDIPPVHSVNPDVPRSVSGIIDHLLVKEVERRQASAGELRDRLDHALSTAGLSADQLLLSSSADGVFNKSPAKLGVHSGEKRRVPKPRSLPAPAPARSKARPLVLPLVAAVLFILVLVRQHFTSSDAVAPGREAAGDKARAGERMEALRALQDACLKRGEKLQATKIVEQMVSIEPENLDLRGQLAVLYLRRVLYDDATDQWIEIIRRDPHRHYLLVQGFLRLTARSATDVAQSLCRRALQVVPHSSAMTNCLANNLLDSGGGDELVALATAAKSYMTGEDLETVQRDARDPRARWPAEVLAVLLSERSSKSAVRLGPFMQIVMREHRLAEWETNLIRAMSSAPETPGKLCLLAEFRARLGKMAEALKMLRRATALAPDWAVPHERLAFWLRKADQPEEAETVAAVADRLWMEHGDELTSQ